MKKQRLICFFLLAGFTAGLHVWGAKRSDPWKTWLAEVAPIITRLELSVAKRLLTLEERDRFKEAFWGARDPRQIRKPQRRGSQNPYKTAYYKRLQYAKKYLRGIKSDRGRIYILLGKPHNKTTFIGHKGLVECELWNYEAEDRPGLLPFMNLVFFRPHNTGDYQLYQPGIHDSRNLLSPVFANRIRSQFQAYGQIKKNSSELASASISIIPGENSFGGASLGSSNFALNRIYSLPEREADQAYVRSFKNPGGSVKVTHSTRVIRGHGYVAVAPFREGVEEMFVHYAMVPDTLNLVEISPRAYAADIKLHINIETPGGKIVFQRQRKISFKADAGRHEKLKQRKVVFRDFAPVIPGEYLIVITFINDSTHEFFTYKQRVTVTENPDTCLYAAIGYKVKPIISGHQARSWRLNDYLLLADPRSNFNQLDTLEGIIFSAAEPEIYLLQHSDSAVKIPIKPIKTKSFLYRFTQPLKEIKDDTYTLHIAGASNSITRKIHILPHYITINRPFVMERPEPADSAHNYTFIRAKQYLAIGKTGRSIAAFEKIPLSLWKSPIVPIIANAYYVKGHYSKVLELLEPAEVKKEYPVLQMLANSCIELKRFSQALKYLQQLRKYGDTIEINQLLAATYLSLGDRENSKRYYQRARDLKNK